MIIRHVSAEPRPGFEFLWHLAWKHRHGWGRLYLATPWWQIRRRNRRWDHWMKAIDRTHTFAQDRVYQTA